MSTQHTPTAGRLRAIGEHIYSLGCYTQAAELDRAATTQNELLAALRHAHACLETIDLHYDSLDRIGVRDLCAEGAQAINAALAKVEQL